MKFNLGKISLKKIITITVAAAVLAGGSFGAYQWKKSKAKKGETPVSFSMVTRGSVEKTISGSGTVEPYERYEIIPLVNGEIINCPYEVGDYIEKGEIVYSFDMTNALLNFEKQNNSMEKSTINYNEAMKDQEKLTVKSPAGGRVTKLHVAVGDEIQSNQVIATIMDDVNLSVKFPFNGEQITRIRVGDKATLSSSTQMSNFSGTVSYVDKTASAAADGTSVYYVTVDFKNPGAVAENTPLGAEINGNICPGFGTVTFGEEKQIKAEAAGTISSLSIAEGAYVKKDAIVARIKSESIESSIKKSKIDYEDAKLSLQSQKDSLEDYNITAPISGTVLTKNSKKGDTIDRTNSSVTMMVIGDVSKLKFSLSIDELDVAQVSTGLKVKITSDAIPGEIFEGEITGISMEGVASNGVTTYDATVTVFNPGKLRPSMNVDAVIVLDSVADAVRVPSSDIITAMGRHFVFVEDPDGSIAKKAAEEAEKQSNSGTLPNGFAPQGERPQMSGGNAPQGERPQMSGGNAPQGEKPQMSGGNAPQGEKPQMSGGNAPQGEKPQMSGGNAPQGERPQMSGGNAPQGEKPQMSGGNAPQGERPQMSGGNAPQGERPQMSGGNAPQGERPQMSGGNAPQDFGGNAPQDNKSKNADNSKNQMPNKLRQPEAPEGFATVQIQIGLQGDDFTEVISGLTEGQRIYRQQISSSSSGFGMMGGGRMPGGMGGGMMGGGRMPGGMSGGRMPGGMAGGMRR